MISNITFGNKTPYVHEGTVFAKKEADKVAQKVQEALDLDWARKLIKGEDHIHTFERPDALIPAQKVDNKSVESYVLSHGGQLITGKTIAKV